MESVPPDCFVAKHPEEAASGRFRRFCKERENAGKTF